MHEDMEVQYQSVVNPPAIIEGGKQILLFSIGTGYYYTEISLIHEIITYPTNNYHMFDVMDNLPMTGILNWYEGLVPIIKTGFLLEEEGREDNYLLIYDIGKEIFAFTVTDIFFKHEVDPLLYGKELKINNSVFNFLDFESFEDKLINLRMGLKRV